MNSVLAQFEAGHIHGFSRMPQGTAIRAVAEIGRGLEGDFEFNRYTVDGRVFTPLNGVMSLGLRGRAGYATTGAPIQKQFTIGGAGSVRAYPQNVFFGSKMVVGNAELTFDAVDFLWSDLTVFGFADFGWTGADFDAFDVDDGIGAGGFGLALDERRIRFEIAWPIDDPLVDAPTFWFRLNPTF